MIDFSKEIALNRNKSEDDFLVISENETRQEFWKVITKGPKVVTNKVLKTFTS